MGNSDRGTKAKSITSCNNAFVTNIDAVAAAALLALRFRAKNICGPGGSSDSPRKLCSVRKRSDSNNVYLRESEASAATKRTSGTEVNPTSW
ncbi:hypothetical protein [Bacillus sp. RS11]|uniref:hypothetical protein n=1 Tax=Lysinibacillus sp. RS11 TaxID=3242682 RepID=UPI0035C68DC6